MSRMIAVVVVEVLLAACGKPPQDLAWKQEVPLQDGRMLVVDRVSKVTGKRFPEGGNYDVYQSLTFTHPDTGERIAWIPPEHTAPAMLDLDGPNVYYVVRAITVDDYNRIGCPNPPYLVYRYADKQWEQIPIDDMPSRFVERNVLAQSREDEDAVADGVVTAKELQAYMKEFPTGMKFQFISRNKINPIAKGCHGDTLQMQGRQSEIDYRR